jgi:hypothetical protein
METFSKEKRLSLGHQVSRVDREMTLAPKEKKKNPAVGHYHPKFDITDNRPKS